MSRPEWIYGAHPPACTCWKCNLLRRAPQPDASVSHRQTPSPVRTGSSIRAEVTSAQERDYGYPPRGHQKKPNGLKGLLSIVITLAVGAAIAVYVVYPFLLPNEARDWVDSVQAKVSTLKH